MKILCVTLNKKENKNNFQALNLTKIYIFFRARLFHFFFFLTFPSRSTL